MVAKIKAHSTAKSTANNKPKKSDVKADKRKLKKPAQKPSRRLRSNTKLEILKAAKGLLQIYGYNGFSFQHVADIVGLQKPSLYEHFPSKENLGEALIADYRNGFEDWAETLQIVSALDKVKSLFELFYAFSKDHQKFCPLTALTADCNALPPGMSRQLRQLHSSQKKWLTSVIETGKKERVFKSQAPSLQLAEVVMNLAYGAQLSARIAKDPLKIRQARDQATKFLNL